jgi:hypothetical protein
MHDIFITYNQSLLKHWWPGDQGWLGTPPLKGASQCPHSCTRNL